MTKLLTWKYAAKVSVLLGVVVLICVFTGINTVSEVFKQETVEDDASNIQHLQPATTTLGSKPGDKYSGNDRPYRANKWRRESTHKRSMEPQELMIDNRNRSQIDHEKREKVKEVI